MIHITFQTQRCGDHKFTDKSNYFKQAIHFSCYDATTIRACNDVHRNIVEGAIWVVIAVSVHVLPDVPPGLYVGTNPLIKKKLYASTTCFCKQHPHAAKISEGQRGQQVIYTPRRNNKQQAPPPSNSNRTECVRTDERTVKAKKKKRRLLLHCNETQKSVHFYSTFIQCEL